MGRCYKRRDVAHDREESRIHRATRALNLVVALVAACASPAEDAAGPPSPVATVTVTATPSTTPQPSIEPVAGQSTVVIEGVDAGPIVFHDRPAPEADQAAIDGLASAVRTWLDRHLTDLQAGGPGLLEEVAAPGLLDGDEPARRAVTDALTGPDRPVEDALYHVVVAHEGAPIWARVTVVVGAADGTVAEAGFVFTPGPELIAAGPQTEVTS